MGLRAKFDRELKLPTLKRSEAEVLDSVSTLARGPDVSFDEPQVIVYLLGDLREDIFRIVIP